MMALRTSASTFRARSRHSCSCPSESISIPREAPPCQGEGGIAECYQETNAMDGIKNRGCADLEHSRRRKRVRSPKKCGACALPADVNDLQAVSAASRTRDVSERHRD